MSIYNPTDRSSAAAARERDQMLHELYTALDRISTPSLPELIPFMRPPVEWRHCTIPEVAAIVNARIFPYKLVPDGMANDVTTEFDWNTLGLVMIDTRSDADPNQPIRISLRLVGNKLVIEGGKCKLTSQKRFQIDSTPRQALEWLLANPGRVMMRKSIDVGSTRRLSDLSRDIGLPDRLRKALIISGTKELALRTDPIVSQREWREIIKACQDTFDVEWRGSSIALG